MSIVSMKIVFIFNLCKKLLLYQPEGCTLSNVEFSPSSQETAPGKQGVPTIPLLGDLPDFR